MTLDTRIAILEPVDASELHAWVNNELLNAPNAVYEVKDDEIWNSPGQGFDAWFMLYHNNGEPMNWRKQMYCDEFNPKYDDVDEFAASQAKADAMPETYAILSFDTAYGFQGEGLSCTQLHVTYILRLIQRFGSDKVLWENEYTGEWHTGEDVAALTEFLGSGVSAMNWFNTVALPVIEREII